MISLKKLIRSFRYAGRGLWQVIKEEQSFRIQLYASSLVIALMIWLPITRWEAITLTLVIIMVLVLELINSIFERMVDILKPRIHHYVEDIKDIMAATVLIASGGALIIGILIFWPYIFR